MIALLGPPPQTLIMDRAKSARRYKWSPAFDNPEGKLCKKTEEYFGGPFWDYDTGMLFVFERSRRGEICELLTYLSLCSSPLGEFLHKDLIPSDFRLEDSVPSLEDDPEKEQFLDFVRGMLRWVPEERKTAKELLDDPWLATSEGDCE